MTCVREAVKFFFKKKEKGKNGVRGGKLARMAHWAFKGGPNVIYFKE
jgi:hypothetical protein